MIVLTAGPASLVRLMRRDEPSQRLARKSGGTDQASSTATATASPPPMHRLATPFRPPRA